MDSEHVSRETAPQRRSVQDAENETIESPVISTQTGFFQYRHPNNPANFQRRFEYKLDQA